MKARLLALVLGVAVLGLFMHAALAVVLTWTVFALNDMPGRQPINMALRQEALAVADPAGNPCTREEIQALRGPVAAVRDYTISGPHTHGNLSVFLIRGADTLKEGKVVPLQAALDRDRAVVHEGGLRIDNFGDAPVFIQAGDIVKGGNQDRVVPYDELVPPGTNQLPLMVFCVEAGRCGPRGQELSTSFQSSTERLPSRGLHLAARYRRSQADVWEGVRQLQSALARNVGASVQSPQSQTSLQLTLENGLVQQSVQAHLDELTALPEREENVIGVAVAVNGRLESAEVYASSALFREMWPRLLRASAVAALAERQPGARADVLSVEELRQLLSAAEAGATCQQERHNHTLVLRQESAEVLLFDTCDPTCENLVVHRSFLVK